MSTAIMSPITDARKVPAFATASLAALVRVWPEDGERFTVLVARPGGRRSRRAGLDLNAAVTAAAAALQGAP